MTLAEEIAWRLRLAGIGADDPGLAAVRAWNQADRRTGQLSEASAEAST